MKKVEQVVPVGNRYHYYRPIIPGQNDDLKRIIHHLMFFGESGFSGSILTGLRITAQNRQLIDAQVVYDTQHKLMKQGFYPQILAYARESGLNYPIFRHTSCAIGSFMKNRCSLGYYQRSEHCDPACRNAIFCAKKPSIKQTAIRIALEARSANALDLHFKENGMLVIDSPITQEQSAFIKNAFGIGVKAENLILSPSERSILGYE